MARSRWFVVRTILVAAALFGLLIGGNARGFAQSISLPVPNYAPGSNGGGGISDVQNFAQWAAFSLNSVGATSATMTMNPCFFPLNGSGFAPQQWFPLAVGVQVKVQDPSGSNSETVYVTGVSAPAIASGSSNPGGFSCGFTATFANAHAAGVKLYSGDFGLGEAAAFFNGGSSAQGYPVTTPGWGGTASTLTTLTSANAIALFAGHPGVLDISTGAPVFYSLQPSTLTALATPAVRVGTAAQACTGSNTVCDGTAVGTWTNIPIYFCVTYIDPLGGESACSTTAHYTTAGSLAINMLSPAASTGAVGWRGYIGSSYAAAYLMPISASNCTLSTQMTLYPVCAMGATGVFPTPTTTTQLPPLAGGSAAAFNPNPMSHNAFQLRPVPGNQYYGFQQDYGPFVVSGALTGGQQVTLGTVQLPTGFLNFIHRALRITGSVTLTPSTGGTIQILGSIGDITDNSSGQPKAVCTDTETTATGTAAIKVKFECDMTVNATGTTGSIMPDGYMMEQLQAGTTTGNFGIESATGAITVDVLDQDALNIVFLQTTAAESTTPPQLLDLHIEVM